MKFILKERFIKMVEALLDSDKNLTKAEIARLMGVKSATFSNHLNPTRPIPEEFIEAFMAKFSLNRDFYETGNGNPLTQSVNKSNNNISEAGKAYTKLKPNGVQIGELIQDDDNSPFIDIGNGQYIMVVPIVPIRAQAGYIEHYNDEGYIRDNFTDKHTFSVSRVYKGRYMAFIVEGNSMDDRTSEAIIEGSTVTGREIQKHHWRNKFHIHRYKDYVIVHEDGIFIKRIIEHDTQNGVITCHSLNTNKDLYPDFELNLDECLQIFNVVNVTQTR